MATKSFEKALLGLMIAAAATPALAGGLERGGYNIDLLFDPSDYAIESTATFVAPQRDVNDAVDNAAKSGPLAPTGWRNTARDSESYWSPRIGAKAAIGERAQDLVAGCLKRMGIGDGGNQAIGTFDGHIPISR